VTDPTPEERRTEGPQPGACQCYPADDNGGIDQRDCPVHDDEPWGIEPGAYYGVAGAPEETP